MPLRAGLNHINRLLEIDADEYVVERGLGEAYTHALIRSHAKSLDSLFVSPLEKALKFTHPHLLDRLAMVKENVKKRNESLAR